jgi:xanthosine utilization system XapX-like protein
MDTLRKQQLFTELMTSIELHDREAEAPPVVSLLGLADKDLREAVIAQACRSNDDFIEHLCMGLTSAYMNTLNKLHEEQENISHLEQLEPDADTIAGLGIAVYLSWLMGQNLAVIKLMGLLGMTLSHEGKEHVAFLQRMFAPPPIAVALKDAYLHLDSLSILQNGASASGEQITEHITSMPFSRVKELMEKEGYDVDELPKSIVWGKPSDE